MSTATEYRQLLTKYAPQPIRSQEGYERALAQLEKLMVPRPNAAHSLLIEVLSTLIEKYESRDYPTPEIAPAEMLSRLLATKGVKPADVAKTTGIPSATLSNVLAQRRGISKQNAFKLGEYFGLSPIVFLGGPSHKKSGRQMKYASTLCCRNEGQASRCHSGKAGDHRPRSQAEVRRVD